MLWNLLQQMQIGRTDQHAMDMTERLEALERQVEMNSRVLTELIKYLEKREGRDLDGDGRIG